MIVLDYVTILDKIEGKASHHFKLYKANVENQLEIKIKQLQFDHWGEYFLNKFYKFSVKHGIIYKRTVTYSP
jgi:hypothetical protein